MKLNKRGKKFERAKKKLFGRGGLIALKKNIYVQNRPTQKNVEKFPILNFFKDPKIERQYLNYHYGGKRDLLRSFFHFLTAVCLLPLVILDMNNHPSHYISYSIVCVISFICGILFLIPVIVRRKYIVEGILFLEILYIEMRQAFVDNTLNKSIPFASGSFIIFAVFHSIFRLRVWLVLIETIIFCVCYTIFIILIVFIIDLDFMAANNKHVTNVYFSFINLLSMYIYRIIIFGMCYFVECRSRDLFIEISKVKETSESVKIENEQSKKMLSNILPKILIEKVRQMKSKNINYVIKQQENGVIFQGDIENFTNFAESNKATELIIMLQFIFSAMDIFTKHTNLEKIKTIGDGYMCTTKINDERSLYERIEKISLFAIASIIAFKKINEVNQWKLRMRSGVHYGKIYHYVYGSLTKLITYDVIGKSIYIVSDLEKNAMGNTILYSKCTYEIIKDQFQFEKIQSISKNIRPDKSFCGFESGNVKYLLNVEEKSEHLKCVKNHILKKEIFQLLNACDFFKSMSVNGSISSGDLSESVLDDNEIDIFESFSDIQSENLIIPIKKPLMNKIYKYIVFIFKCISPNGLIKYLLMYKSFKKEYEYQSKIVYKSISMHIFLNVLLICMNILILIYSWISSELWKSNYDLFYMNSLMINIYILIILEVIFLIILLFIYKFKQRISINIIYIINTFITIINYISLFKLLLNVLIMANWITFTDQIFFFIQWFVVIFIVWIEGIPLPFRLLLAFTTFIPHVLKIIIHTYVDMEKSILDGTSFTLGSTVGICFSFIAREFPSRLTKQNEFLLQKQTKELKLEKKKNQSIILSVLPKFVMTEIIEKSEKSLGIDDSLSISSTSSTSSTSSQHSNTIFDKRERKTVLNNMVFYFSPNSCVCFVSIGNFYALLNEEVNIAISFLSNLFCEFDSILLRAKKKYNKNHGENFRIKLMKIKSFQETYMFVSHGMPNYTSNEHVKLVIESAFQFFDSFKELSKGINEKFNENLKVFLKVGISKGLVCGCVIGSEKFLYDILGKNVNVASRCCYQSINNEIYILEETKSIIKDIDNIVIEIRNKSMIKGIGKKQLYAIKRTSNFNEFPY